MTAPQAVQLVIKEISAQDPTGDRDTLVLSPLLAAKLCQSDELDVPLDVLKQDGFPALQKSGILGYEARVDARLRGYMLNVEHAKDL